MFKKMLLAAVAALMLYATPVIAQEERFFAVTAYNEWGESAYSEEVSIEWTGPETVTIMWNPVAEATGYKVYWGKASRTYLEPEDVGSNISHTFVRCPAPTGVIINLETGEITVVP